MEGALLSPHVANLELPLCAARRRSDDGSTRSPCIRPTPNLLGSDLLPRRWGAATLREAPRGVTTALAEEGQETRTRHPPSRSAAVSRRAKLDAVNPRAGDPSTPRQSGREMPAAAIPVICAGCAGSSLRRRRGEKLKEGGRVVQYTQYYKLLQ
jgi:hypothetical protein